MSWLLGCTSKTISPILKSTINSLTSGSLYSVDTDRVYLHAGGLVATCHHPNQKESDPFWLALGSGVRLTDSRSFFYSRDDWRSVLQQTQPNLSNISGGFLLLRKTENGLEFFCDSIGFRTVYLAKLEESVIFSTRLDWIAQLLTESSIDLPSFSSRWLLFNQISYDSPLKNVVRLGPLGYANVTPTTINHHYTFWNPSAFPDASIIDACSLAYRFMMINSGTSYKLKLGISGGVDSRVLLSILLSKNIPFTTYTFGADDEPDIKIAKQLAHQENFNHIVLNEPMPSVEDCILLINDYVGQANLNEPLSTLLRLRNIPNLVQENTLTVDGAFGEVARRQYFNRIAINGKKFLVEKNIEALLPFFRVHRADIFNDEVNNSINSNALKQIADLLDSMPSIKEIGVESYLDLLAVRSRIPNFGADEQARLDTIILNLMPFATLDYLNLSFSLSLPERRDGKMFRNIIKKEKTSLAHFPFVKFGTTYPFWMTSLQSWMWTRVKSKTGQAYNDNSLHIFLNHIRDHIFDTMNSISTQNYNFYNYGKVRALVTEYFSGNLSRGIELNWWYTFEMWRRKVEK